MKPYDSDLEDAKILDKIFQRITKVPSEQVYISRLEKDLEIDHFKLRKLLESAPYAIEINKRSSRVHGAIEGVIEPSENGRYLETQGFSFVNKLLSDRKADRNARRFSWVPRAITWILAASTILFAYLHWDAMKETKLHNQKEERWELEKINMQSQIDAATKQLNAIPDSVKMKYLE